jgi:hypothetical protein
MFRDILGPIPNLEIGYLYQFGNNIRTGRLSLDYVFPATVWDNQAVFAEAHGEFTNFWKTLQRLLRVRRQRKWESELGQFSGELVTLREDHP